VRPLPPAAEVELRQLPPLLPPRFRYQAAAADYAAPRRQRRHAIFFADADAAEITPLSSMAPDAAAGVSSELMRGQAFAAAADLPIRQRCQAFGQLRVIFADACRRRRQIRADAAAAAEAISR